TAHDDRLACRIPVIAWAILRNPAYRGKACYGKTELRPRQRITRPLRQRKGLPSRDSANHERARAEWIPIPVPALVSEEMFELAQEQLEKNKKHSPTAYDRTDIAARDARVRAVWLGLIPVFDDFNDISVAVIAAASSSRTTSVVALVSG